MYRKKGDYSMASNLDTVTLWETAREQFIELILPMIQEDEQRLGHVDIPARSEAWSNFVDALHYSGSISDWQVSNWEHPPCCD
jgi:hypothetical protein